MKKTTKNLDSNLENFIEMGQLFEIYGKLLSQDRQEIMSEYFVFNNTLVEIAETRNISRQAVLDAVNKSCEKLKQYEEILKFYQNGKNLTEQVKNLKTYLQEKYPNDDKLQKKVENILKKI